jgi:hypothetical protein
VLLQARPFREGQQHQAVARSLHLGVMQGALPRMRAPVTADRLELRHPRDRLPLFSAAAGTLAALLVIAGVIILARHLCSCLACGPPSVASTT